MTGPGKKITLIFDMYHLVDGRQLGKTQRMDPAYTSTAAAATWTIDAIAPCVGAEMIPAEANVMVFKGSTLLRAAIFSRRCLIINFC